MECLGEKGSLAYMRAKVWMLWAWRPLMTIDQLTCNDAKVANDNLTS